MNVVWFQREDTPPDATAETVLARLLANRACVQVRPDPARLAVQFPQALRDLPAAGPLMSPYTPRATRALFAFADAPLADNRQLIRTTVRTAGDLLGELGDDLSAAPDETHIRTARRLLEALPEPDEWAAWYPLIDRGRCTDCGRCVNYCLFGVYDPGPPVRVHNPRACKNRCPACAPLCPVGAIIFPRHPAAPINGAEPTGDEPTPDIQSLLDGDVLESLRRQGITAETLNALHVQGHHPPRPARPDPESDT